MGLVTFFLVGGTFVWGVTKVVTLAFEGLLDDRMWIRCLSLTVALPAFLLFVWALFFIASLGITLVLG